MIDPHPPGVFEFRVDPADEGKRLDVVVAERCPGYSRVQLRRAINGQGVRVDGRGRKAAYRVKAGEHVRIELPEPAREGPAAEALPLDILYEDEFLAAVNKPSGMVVHPARGHWSGTLAGALSYHFQQLSQAGGATRPGIVHRLDRDTSGVILVAKTDSVHLNLARQFESRRVEKEYFAVCRGAVDRDRDVIRQPIGIHPYQREKMAIRENHPSVRDAETYYEVDRRWRGFTAFRVFPRTGRTHQIRVHLAHLNCPIVCDPLYAGHARLTWGELTGDAADQRILLDRLALHARRIRFTHPESGEPVTIEAPVPNDISQLIEALDRHRGDARPVTRRPSPV